MTVLSVGVILIESADTHMSDLTEMTPVIERGLSLHKIIRYERDRCFLTSLA